MRRSASTLLTILLLGLLVAGFLAFFVPRVVPRGFAVEEATGLRLSDLLFYALATLTVAGAAAVALSRNILRSALGLLFALLGTGSLYVYLSADFLAVTQLLVYIGGVLVLILFAVMLTSRIGDPKVSNTSFGIAGGLALFAAVTPIVVLVAALVPWATRPPEPLAPTTARVGNAFLSTWLLPFEVVSVLLLATLVGAVVVARKEMKAD